MNTQVGLSERPLWPEVFVTTLALCVCGCAGDRNNGVPQSPSTTLGWGGGGVVWNEKGRVAFKPIRLIPPNRVWEGTHRHAIPSPTDAIILGAHMGRRGGRSRLNRGTFQAKGGGVKDGGVQAHAGQTMQRSLTFLSLQQWHRPFSACKGRREKEAKRIRRQKEGQKT